MPTPILPRPRPESERPTEQVKLRLDAADALALRVAAAANGRTISAHVARLVATAGDPEASRREPDLIADVSQMAARVARIPESVQRMQGELMRQGGLIKSLFVGDTLTADLAEAHARECSETLGALLAAAERAGEAAARVEADLADVRAELRAGVLRLCGRI